MDFCKEIFGDFFRLKALRYYENFGGQHMQWHTDNRRYDESEKGETHTSAPGIIFLAYLSDVDDGEFQYIEKSHIWARDKFGSNRHYKTALTFWPDRCVACCSEALMLFCYRYEHVRASRNDAC